MIVIATGFILLSPLSVVFDNGYDGKQPVAWKEYCAKYQLQELPESMNRCTGCHDITEILQKNSIKHQTIYQSLPKQKHFTLVQIESYSQR